QEHSRQAGREYPPQDPRVALQRAPSLIRRESPGFGVHRISAATPERRPGRAHRGLVGAVAEVDAPLAEIVGRELERHLVAGEDADPVLLHLSGHVRHDLVAVVQPDAEARVGKLVGDDALHFDKRFLGHATAFRSTADLLPSSSLLTSYDSLWFSCRESRP